jgi:hypothetical protein
MNYKLITFIVGLALFSCKKDDSLNNNNPNLLTPLVTANLNLNLPQYNALKFPGGSFIIAGQGIKGVVVYNVNNDLYTAFELSDPNHVPSSCSKMTISDIIASCPCSTDDNEYDIITGQHKTNQGLYPMQQYRAVRTGDNLQISN